MVRVIDGSVKVGDQIQFMATDQDYEVTQLGIFTPFQEERPELLTGEVGYVCASIKTIGHTKIGDTITLSNNPAH